MQDTLDILCGYGYDDDYVEHHGVPGMRWGHRKQKQLSNIRRREDRNKKNLTDRSYSSLTNCFDLFMKSALSSLIFLK